MTDAERRFLSYVALGWFSVDSEGRIWRHRQVVRGSQVNYPPSFAVDPPVRADTGRSKNYLRVQFTDEGQRFRAYAHRIVWMVSNGADIPDLMEVNHKDGVGSNNRPPNLEILTKSGNALHALHELGKLANRNLPGAKLTAEQVLEIRDLRDQRVLTRGQIAAMYGVSEKTVRNIDTRAMWSHLPG